MPTQTALRAPLCPGRMANDATSSVGRRGRTSRPERVGEASSARRRLAKEGSGRVPTRPDPNADRTRSKSKIAIELTRARCESSTGGGRVPAAAWSHLLGKPLPAEVRLPFAPGEAHVGATVSLSELAHRRSLAVCFYSGGESKDAEVRAIAGQTTQ